MAMGKRKQKPQGEMWRYRPETRVGGNGSWLERRRTR